MSEKEVDAVAPITLNIKDLKYLFDVLRDNMPKEAVEFALDFLYKAQIKALEKKLESAKKDVSKKQEEFNLLAKKEGFRLLSERAKTEGDFVKSPKGVKE